MQIDILLIYTLYLHGFLCVAVWWGNNWRKRYQQVAYDEYALERVRKFFSRLASLLEKLYLQVDTLEKNKGRPAIDRHFQLRFLLWWKFFGPEDKVVALRKFNFSPILQEILNVPSIPYSRQALTRFEIALGNDLMEQMIQVIAAELHERGFFQFTHVIVDSFPVKSWLNNVKCLTAAKFNVSLAQRIFTSLNLRPITLWFPPAKKTSIAHETKLKCWIHHLLWNIPSAALAHNLVFGKEARWKILGITQPMKGVGTYREFLRVMAESPHREKIEQMLVAEITRVCQLLQIKPLKWPLKSLDDLRWIFTRPHQVRDPGIQLTQCTTKDTTFFGRGGILACLSDLEIPIFVQLSSKYKQSVQSNVNFFQQLFHAYKTKLKGVRFYGDGEFGLPELQKLVKDYTGLIPSFSQFGGCQYPIQLASDHYKRRLTVERVLGRLTVNFHLETPRCLGFPAVNFHLHLCVLCDLLQVYFNCITGNQAHPHAMIPIRG